MDTDPETPALDDTLPPPGAGGRGGSTQYGFSRRRTEQLTPFESPAVEAPKSISQTIAALSEDEEPPEPRNATLTLGESVSMTGHKRVWIAADEDGVEYRLEERKSPSPEAVPEAVREFTWLLDVPIAATTHGQHEVKVYRHIAGLTLHERLQERDGPLTPTEIVEWIRPVTRALAAVHDAGFLCLRICPYTVKYSPEGHVFLQNVEILYPRDTALATLPAIAGYTAPEIYSASIGEPPSTEADVYSVAMLVYYLIARADPPASIYSGHAPALLARDFAPDFPLGFAPVLGVIGALDPGDRPGSVGGLMTELDRARARAVRGVSGAATTLAVATDTHAGVLKRQQAPINQDNVYCGLAPDRTTAFMLVADGVSTASFGSGDLASGIARACAEEAWESFLTDPDNALADGAHTWLDKIIQTINRRVVQAVNADHAPFEGEPSEVMGSTCILAFVNGGVCHLMSLGDSRAYLIREGYMEQITRDHNLLTLGIADGLDPDTAIMLPQGDALARCLGSFEIHSNGKLVPFPVQPDHYVFSLASGDHLVICTDGLTDYAAPDPADAEERIYHAVLDEPIPDLLCLDLIRLANRGGGGDNIGVAVCVADPDYNSLYDWFASRVGN